MRTKTLLIAVAALAVGILTSSAQTYSQNVVGYVNINLNNGVLACVSPALDLDGTGTNNTIATVIGTNVPTATYVYALNSSGGFDQLVYKSSGHPAVTAWYLGTAVANNYPINPGQGVFILPGGDTTITEVGTVLQGPLSNSYVPALAGGIGLVSSQVPIAGGVTTALSYTPTLGDIIFVYDPIVGYDQYIYKASGHPAVTGWYIGTTLSEPQINVGQGFWLQPKNAGEVWNNNFIVQ